MQCIHQTVDLHYAIAKGTRVYPIENSIEVHNTYIRTVTEYTYYIYIKTHGSESRSQVK